LLFGSCQGIFPIAGVISLTGGYWVNSITFLKHILAIGKNLCQVFQKLGKHCLERKTYVSWKLNKTEAE
jgi:hypothetical protein